MLVVEETKKNIEIKIGGIPTMEEAKEIEEQIIAIVKTHDKDTKIIGSIRRVCDGCGITLNVGDSFLSKNGLDFCTVCQKDGKVI